MPWPTPLHPLQWRTLAEDVVRRRSAGDPRRMVAPQRAAHIDPNPHQLEAVVFALRRLREGGCILADEVGLGKTIEAGLVITQLRAEGAKRVLLVTPRSLVGQWSDELLTLFELDIIEARPREGAFDGDGVFIINREAVGTAAGFEALSRAEPFDLCVVDEAHEVFAGVYKRFGANGLYDAEAPVARTAGRLREALQAHHTPVLLLTATPIQNNLAELWGLVQYVDPQGTLLGDLATFREAFCGESDRVLVPGQEHELRERLRTVLQRTLRRQAQPFLERPFVDREARLFSYDMSEAERSLYDDVTRYLLEPRILAFQGSHRQLLLLGFHRRMASSTAALAASLDRVASRLERLAQGEPVNDDVVAEFTADLSDDTEFEPATEDGAPPWATLEAYAAELARVRGYVARARALEGADGKFEALAAALGFVARRAARGEDSGKLVIFTESLVTQDHLRRQLVARGLASDEDITLFRGVNDSARARAALERWRTEVAQEGRSLRPDVAQRLALVHEFKTRSKVFISTEAGAKGLNLQFCSTVVNYDLPWNPQRIEQRIGRCHRYGQRHAVTVINFLARGNEAQRLTFDILSQKLELFGAVLDASDVVLHRGTGLGDSSLVGALGAQVEGELRRIYDRARSVEDITEQLRDLRDRVDGERQRFLETHARTAQLIASHLDDEVQRVFTQRQAEFPAALVEFDRSLQQLIEPSTVASEAHAFLHATHPLVQRAVIEARATPLPKAVNIRWPPLAGRRGRLRLVRLVFEGFEVIERLVPVMVLDDGQALDGARALDILQAHITDAAPVSTSVDEATMTDGVDAALWAVQREVDEAEHEVFERATWRSERALEDRLLVLRRALEAAHESLKRAVTRRDGATGAEARTTAEQAMAEAQREVEQLEEEHERLLARDDEAWRRHRAHNQRRRYRAPTREVLYDVAVRFEAARGTPPDGE